MLPVASYWLPVDYSSQLTSVSVVCIRETISDQWHKYMVSDKPASTIRYPSSNNRQLATNNQ